MLALIGAVLFLVALILELAGISLGTLTDQVFVTAGLLCVALYMAGIGGRHWRR